LSRSSSRIGDTRRRIAIGVPRPVIRPVRTPYARSRPPRSIRGSIRELSTRSNVHREGARWTLVAVILAVGAIGGRDISAENLKIAQRAYEAFQRGGVEEALEYLHPEIEWNMSEQFARASRAFHGYDGVREVAAIFDEYFDDLRAEPREFIDAGDKVIVPVRLHGRLKGTGEKAEYDLVQVWTLRMGRAVRLDAYSDRDEALREAGNGSG
jgi:ketosteroid isomerase-like protein